MLQDWPSTGMMLLAFPALCLVLLIFVHLVVEFAPCTIREHKVNYRRIQTHVADLLLIIRLALQRH